MPQRLTGDLLDRCTGDDVGLHVTELRDCTGHLSWVELIHTCGISMNKYEHVWIVQTISCIISMNHVCLLKMSVA